MNMLNGTWQNGKFKRSKVEGASKNTFRRLTCFLPKLRAFKGEKDMEVVAKIHGAMFAFWGILVNMPLKINMEPGNDGFQ